MEESQRSTKIIIPSRGHNAWIQVQPIIDCSLGSGLRNRDGVSANREVSGEPWCLGTSSGHLSHEGESRGEMAKPPLTEKAEPTREEGSGCKSCDF